MKRKKTQLLGLLSLALIISQLVGACSNEDPTLSPTLPTSPTVLAATTVASSPAVARPAAAATPVGPIATPTSSPLAPEIKGVTPSAAQVGRYNKFELTIALKDIYTNPFDPAQIDLHATFTSPNGTGRTIPGFYWQDYTSQPNGTKEVLTATGQPAWKVRFSPTETGLWTYFVEAVTPGGKASTTPAKLEVTASDNPGYLRVSRQDPAYLEFSTGKPYFAIGQNVGWYGAGGWHDYERWFKQMGANGANFARIWMPSWGAGIEWSDGPLGDYSKRLDRAWQMDQIFNLAEQNNIYIMLSLLNHGAFSKTTDSEWSKNPYNAALGGPIAEPQDFATNRQARDLFKRRLRYIVARWGYSSHLLAWEWWNEVDYTPISNRALLKPWIQEMNTALQSWEGYPHLRTISYARTFDDEIYNMPEIDLVERHEYSPQEPASTFPTNMAKLRTFGKPAFYGEFGSSGDGADTTLDKAAVHLHNAQWASLMTKGFGTSMSWWWDTYIDPLNLYHLFNEQTAFLQPENLAAQHYQPDRVETGVEATALILKSDTRILGWVKNNAFGYQAIKEQYEAFLRKALADKQKPGLFVPNYPSINNAKLTFENITPGIYRVEWWSTEGKGMLKTESQTTKGSTLVLPVPAFDKDLAFKLILAG